MDYTTLSTGACWLQAKDGPILGLYVFDGENIIKVTWLDGVESKSGVLAFADLLQRGVITFFRPEATDGLPR